MSSLGQKVARPLGSEKDVNKGRVQTTTVRRHWAGKAPVWVEDQRKENIRKKIAQIAKQHEREQDDAEVRDEETVVRTEVQAPVIIAKKSDPRLARLQATGDLEEARRGHRRIREDEMEEKEREKATSDREDAREALDDDAIERRRAAIKARAQALREAEEAEAQKAQEARQESGSDAESSEYETDSEYESDSSDERGRLVRPVFVPKGQRSTAQEKKAAEEAEKAALEREEARLEERREETKALVAEAIHLEEQKANAKDDETVQLEAIDTDDDEDDETEFDSWRRRELDRIRRWHAEKEEERLKREEAERLRAMTEEEKAREAAMRQPDLKVKSKMKFMQKYYHKGAFFNAEADDKMATTGTFDILNRDFSEAVGGDRVDKSSLPSVLHVRANDFGKRSRTKWTHLVAEDTSQPLLNSRAGAFIARGPAAGPAGHYGGRHGSHVGAAGHRGGPPPPPGNMGPPAGFPQGGYGAHGYGMGGYGQETYGGQQGFAGQEQGAPPRGAEQQSLGVPLAMRKRALAGTEEVFDKPKKYRT